MAEDGDATTRRLLEQAEHLAQAEGLGDGLASVGDPDWARLLAGVEAAARRDDTDLPENWRETLTAARDRARLKADRDDARLAEEGEVFSREDDA